MREKEGERREKRRTKTQHWVEGETRKKRTTTAQLLGNNNWIEREGRGENESTTFGLKGMSRRGKRKNALPHHTTPHQHHNYAGQK